MNEPIKTVSVVIIKDDSVLLVRHGQGSSHITDSYGLPAGRVDDGETEEEAAIRELEEETGLQAQSEDLRKIPVTYEATLERKDGAKLFTMTAFRLDRFIGELRASEEASPEWTPLSGLDSLPLIPNVARAIKDARKLA